MLENTQHLLHGNAPVAKTVLCCSVLKSMTHNLGVPGVSLGTAHQITNLVPVERREYVDM